MLQRKLAVYQNKQFLQNATHYLMGHSDWLDMRNKAVDITSIDLLKKEEFESSIKTLSVLIPLLVLAILSIVFRFLRKRTLG